MEISSPKRFKVSILTSDIDHEIDNLIEAQNRNPDLFHISQLISNKKEIIYKYEKKIKIEGENSIISKIQFFLIGFEDNQNSQPFNKKDKDYYLKISTQILNITKSGDIDIILLDGFYVILVDPLISNYAGHIINVHPSLLPKFKGKGMFGQNVHKAVINAKEKESGVTVHLVDLGIDSGEILSQKSVSVDENETPDTLSKKIKDIRIPAIIDALKILQKRF